MSNPSPAHFEQQINELIARRELGRAEAAAASCRATWPNATAGWLLGSIVALLADDAAKALELVEERLGQEPRDVQCLLQKGESLLALGRRDEALAAATQAVGEAGDDPVALEALCDFFVHSHQHAQALTLLDRILGAAPDRTAVLAKRAVLHRFLGHFELAARDYEAVLTRTPGDAEALKGLADLGARDSQRSLITRLHTALARVDPQSNDAAVLNFGLAKSYEDVGEYAASWRHVSAANRIERRRLEYDRHTDQAVFDHMISGFDQIEVARPDSTGERPIFIVGLPRTGTTLVERIIGRHSQIHSAGELTALSEAVGITFKRLVPQGHGWLAYAASLPSLDGELIAREYLARSRARRGARLRFSDKNPLNFFYAPIILRAFPRAHIVHLTRHPLAACYAIYKTRFEGTFPFSYELEELADFYVGYRRLMAHWHRVLPGRILDVAYEDVVTALEPTVRRLLESLELPFETACLAFEANTDAAMTASAIQVRQPLYETSLDQWRHYAGELAPLRSRLESAGIPIE